MNFTARPHECVGDPRAGGKAEQLAMLAAGGLPVPDWFLVWPGAADLMLRRLGRSPALGTRLPDEVRQQLARLGDPDQSFAVRSSAPGEDGASSSFAGQYRSCLQVSASQVLPAIAQVLASADGRDIETYRRQRGLNKQAATPAVIVQRMVAARAAGVAFSADPVSGRRGITVISAVGGIGDKLVNGERQGDCWQVDRQDRIIAYQPEVPGARPVLSDDEVLEVAVLARRCAALAGCPQDIEWALEGKLLWLLQSRAITTLKNARDPDGRVAIWDNSNIVESFSGITGPLTFSVARTAYSHAYRNFMRVLGVSEKTIAGCPGLFDEMLGLIHGRVYYNLINWYRLLAMIPGFRFNRGFMEQMMGVGETLPAGALPAVKEPGIVGRFRGAVSLVRICLRLVAGLLVHRRAVRRFHARLETVLAPLPLAQLSAEELIDVYQSLQQEVIPSWRTPLANDLYCMIFHGALRKASTSWLGPDSARLDNLLVRGAEGLISTEPARQLQALAALVRGKPALIKLLGSDNRYEIRARIGALPALAQAIDAYLERFGDRCVGELKLESKTLRDDPLPLFRAIASLADMPAQKAQAPQANWQGDFTGILRAFVGHPLRRIVFRLLAGQARARIRDRENLRFERTRVYGRVRALFVELGRRLENTGILERANDVFYLEAEELVRFVRGSGTHADLRSLVRQRRYEYRQWHEQEAPPRRFMSIGVVGHPDALETIETPAEPAAGDMRTAIACSPGVVTGRVRVVKDPRTDRVEPGDIVVAEQTDPGWITVFPLVTALIVERGSLLSHSAIVARELGIPAVVGLADACNWLRDGDLVEVDGKRGTVQRKVAEELAA